MPAGGKTLADFADHEAGSIVWNASLVLLNHLRAHHAAEMRGKRVLELGAGLGHLAWGLYEMGADVTASNTPLGGDLKELQECVEGWKHEESEGKVPAASTYIRKALGGEHFGEAGSREPGGAIRVVELTWGEEHWKDSPLSKEVAEGANPPYDIIILAEVFSIPDLHPELVWTVKQFCHRNIVIWSMFMNRPFSFMFFVHVADSGGFRVHQFKEEEYDVCGLDTEDVHCMLHRTTFDPQSPRLMGTSAGTAA